MERNVTSNLAHVENEKMAEEEFISPTSVGSGGQIVSKRQPWAMLDAALSSGDLSAVTSLMNGDVSFIPPFPSHPPESGYLRHLLWRTQRFALIALVWAPGSRSAIHAHGGSRCWVRLLSGSLTETVYSVSNIAGGSVQLMELSRDTVKAGNSSYVDDGLGVHDMANEPVLGDCAVAISLHLYSPPFDTCEVYREVDGGVIVEQAPLTFHSVYGDPVTF